MKRRGLSPVLATTILVGFCIYLTFAVATFYETYSDVVLPKFVVAQEYYSMETATLMVHLPGPGLFNVTVGDVSEVVRVRGYRVVIFYDVDPGYVLAIDSL